MQVKRGRGRPRSRQRQEDDLLVNEILPDPMAVQDKQPGYRYRLFRADPTRLAQAQAMGYEPVMRSDPESLVGDVGGKEAGGVQRFVDTILHRIPEELARKRDYVKAERMRRSNRVATRVFEAEAGRRAQIEGEVRIEGPQGSFVDRQGQSEDED